MGQSTSSTSQNWDAPTTPPKVETPHQFIERFRSLVASEHLELEELAWLQMIFTKFEASPSGTPKNRSTYWGEASVVEFISATLPAQWESTVVDAGPLLYRCLKRLGHIPFHIAVGSELPEQVLTADVLTVAVSILLGRPIRRGSGLIEPPWYGTDDDGGVDIDYVVDERGEDSPFELRAEAWRLRLLFQCLREREGHVGVDDDVNDGNEEASSSPRRQRTREDETDLKRAYDIVSDANCTRKYPKTRIPGDPMIPMEYLPSSRSADLSGRVSVKALRPLIGLLLLFSRLWHRGPFRLHEAVPLQLEPAVQAICNAFAAVAAADPGQTEGTWITWEELKSVIATSMPNPLSSFGYLFRPFINGGNLDHSAVAAAKKHDAGVLIRGACRGPRCDAEGWPVNPNHTTGAALQLGAAILVQLATFLHPGCCPETASPLFSTYSGGNMDVALNHIRQHVLDLKPGDDTSKPLLLLVSGRKAAAVGGAVGGGRSADDRHDDADILCGLYLTAEGPDAVAYQRDRDVMFQLRPIHRAIRATHLSRVHLLPPSEHNTTTWPRLVFQCHAPTASCSAGRDSVALLSLSSSVGGLSGQLDFPSTPPVAFSVNDIHLYNVNPVRNG